MWEQRALSARREIVALAADGLSVSELHGAAYGLSPRERDVRAEVMAGRSTAEIGRALTISPHTAHDHLKAIFGKVGVQSRGELVAALRPADPNV